MLVQIFGVLFCGLWVVVLIYTHRSARNLALLEEVVPSDARADGDWPLLSIIVPACNESDHIEAALHSLLSQDYPQLEIIVIDDRSTDATGEIVDRVAAADARVRPLHIDRLPAGWLGKVHAMHCGVQEANGQWYLFTDADVHFQPGALRATMLYALEQRVDHLACLPKVDVGAQLWLDVTVKAFFLLFCVSTRLADVNREGSERPIGIGAFNLVRRSAFERTEGFRWLRMEPADDVGLGVMLKQAGARTRMLNAFSAMSVSWYESLGAMVRGLEKNSFGPGANYSYWRQAAIVAFLFCLALVPTASLVSGIGSGDPILLGAGSIAVAASVIAAFVLPRYSQRDIVGFLLMPVGIVLVALIMLRSAYICFRNGGVHWRGTHYAVADLRQGQRVRF